MKAFFDILKVSSVILGSVIGAGFISGTELNIFYHNSGVIVCVILTCLLFIFTTVFTFLMQKRYKTYLNSCKKIFVYPFIYKLFTLFTALVFFTAMLSGVELDKKVSPLPILSFLTVVIVLLTAKKGVRLIEKINSTLMPITIIGVFIAIILGGRVNVKINLPTIKGSISASLYVLINAFACAPTLFECAEKKSKSTLIISAIISSIILSLLTVLILFSLKSGYQNSLIIKSLTIIGAFTCAFTYFVPIKRLIFPRYRYKGLICVCAISFILSRLGVSAIVKYFYPLIGGIGGVYFIRGAFLTFGGIKRSKKDYTENT